MAKLLAHMKPPLETPAAASAGFYELTIPGVGPEAPLSYLVQLPPEYDPYRRYPAIVTLHGAGTKPEHQIDWWAGAHGPDGTRLGQATRYGYIVIAPRWGKEHQFQYGFTAVEHAAALNSLRDACKRFSIDTDRVFLSGHSMGGDAAWDIGLSHPDLWAGVIPIVAVADKYCAHYWPNARELPLYFVCGELDGNKMVKNSPELDRYLTKIGFNATVVGVPGPRARELFRRDPEPLRLDEPLPPQLLPAAYRDRQHAQLGQLLLVAGAGRAAREEPREPGRLAQARCAGHEHRGQHRGQQQHPHQDRRRPRERLALAGPGRFQPARADAGQRRPPLRRALRSARPVASCWKTCARAATASIPSGPRSNPPPAAG